MLLSQWLLCLFQPRDLETDNKSVHSYDEGSLSVQQQVVQTVNQNQVTYVFYCYNLLDQELSTFHKQNQNIKLLKYKVIMI